LQLIKRDKNHQNSSAKGSTKIAFRIASEIFSPVLLKKAFLLTTLLCLFFLATQDHIKAQIASIISEDGDGVIGVTSLMNATINGDTNAVKFFAKSGGEVVNQRNIGGASALHIAARMGNIEISTILIGSGANVNIADNEGWTPLMRAIMANNIGLVKLLMNHGADPRKMNSVGETAIINSASARCSECLEHLLSNYNFVDNLNIDVLGKQLNDAAVIASNKNDLETQSIIKEYYNSELSKRTIYSLGKSYSPSETPITPMTDNGDGVVKVKSLNDMPENMPESKNPIYRFVTVKRNEPFLEPSSSKIPQKISPIVVKSLDDKVDSEIDNQKFVFKGKKKSYAPINNKKQISDGEVGVGIVKPYDDKSADLLKTTTGAAIISDQQSTNKKFIFGGSKKAYMLIPMKESVVNTKKKDDILKKYDSTSIPSTGIPSTSTEMSEASFNSASNPSSAAETTDKKFIFKGISKPSSNATPNINPNNLKITEAVVDNAKTEEAAVNSNTEEVVNSNMNSHPSMDKKFIFKGTSKSFSKSNILKSKTIQ